MHLPSSLHRRWLLATATLVAAAAVSPRGEAALGGDAASVAALEKRLGATRQVVERDRFTIHELALPTGANLREFVSPSGKVFAVSWSGGWRPNLRDIMGEHYDRFIAAPRARRARSGIVRIELPGMVAVMGSYLRTFWGQVVLTDLVPAGLAPEELR
jgi:hypothetical protein